MAIPANMWLTDDGGAEIKGSVDVVGREGSIEILALTHSLILPVDHASGKVTSTRQHSSIMLEKEIDKSSTYLNLAVAHGKTLKSAEIRFYKINYSGQEECYYKILLENVKVTSVNTSIPKTKLASSQINHIEHLCLSYERIT